MALAIAFLILLVAAPAVYGVDYTVGDGQGWADSGVDYKTWVSGKTFTVGDTLVFSFLSNHRVDEVNLADYTGCSSSNPINSYASSPANITLSKAGTSYYICPTPGHCANGQKLEVNVVAAGTPSGTPPPATSPTTPAPPTTTPAPPTTTPAPPTTTTPASNHSPPPPPPPPKTSPASSLQMSLVGVPLVLASLVAVMG